MIKSTPWKSKKDRQFISELAKGLEVLQCFTPTSSELSVSDIARKTGIPQPSAWRICHTLMQLGFLIPVQGRQTIRLGIPVLTLGYAALSKLSFGDLALNDMQLIANRHSGAVSLGARYGLDMVYIQRCQGSAIVLADLRVGSRVPIATSATGWAYIAGLDEISRATLLAEIRDALGKEWPPIERKLVSALKGFAKVGFVINEGSLHPRINGVAVPIRPIGSSTILSLSSGGINEVFTPPVLNQVGAELKNLAAKLEPLFASAASI